MNVLVINGHPRQRSLSEALAKAYAEGASSVGMNVRCIDVNKLQFELNVTHYSPHNQFTEPCITDAQQQIHWANHVVFVYPTWWGTMPAMLKGFIDRVFTSGFAFDEIEGGTGYAPLLRGKTAQVITTMDTPVLVYKLVNRAPGDTTNKISSRLAVSKTITLSSSRSYIWYFQHSNCEPAYTYQLVLFVKNLYIPNMR